MEIYIYQKQKYNNIGKKDCNNITKKILYTFFDKWEGAWSLVVVWLMRCMFVSGGFMCANNKIK